MSSITIQIKRKFKTLICLSIFGILPIISCEFQTADGSNEMWIKIINYPDSFEFSPQETRSFSITVEYLASTKWIGKNMIWFEIQNPASKQVIAISNLIEVENDYKTTQKTIEWRGGWDPGDSFDGYSLGTYFIVAKLENWRPSYTLPSNSAMSQPNEIIINNTAGNVVTTVEYDEQLNNEVYWDAELDLDRGKRSINSAFSHCWKSFEFIVDETLLLPDLIYYSNDAVRNAILANRNNIGVYIKGIDGIYTNLNDKTLNGSFLGVTDNGNNGSLIAYDAINSLHTNFSNSIPVKEKQKLRV